MGGTILSSKLAMERGWAINVGGGFHHCSANEGGGFCVYADITLCIQFALVRFNISRWVWFSSIRLGKIEKCPMHLKNFTNFFFEGRWHPAILHFH